MELNAEGLNAPIFLVSPLDDSARRIVSEQIGVAYVLMHDGQRLTPPFVDLRAKMTPLLKAFDERGLLALTFHPKFSNNGLI
jgi:hypothetical protein